MVPAFACFATKFHILAGCLKNGWHIQKKKSNFVLLSGHDTEIPNNITLLPADNICNKHKSFLRKHGHSKSTVNQKGKLPIQ